MLAFFLPLHGFFCCSVWFFCSGFYYFSCPVSFGHGRIPIFGIPISSHVALLGTCSITITRHFTALQYTFLFSWARIRFLACTKLDIGPKLVII
jgi:hypothetical protein